MKTLVPLFFSLVCAVVFLGCRAGKHLASQDNQTQIIVHEKLVPVYRPSDSATIRALLECDSSGRVVLSWLDLAQSENARLKFQLDSMGNLLADFRVPSDTVFILGKDSTIIKTTVERAEVEKELSSWQKFCMRFTIIVMVVIVLFVGFKFRSILNLFR